MTSKNIAVQAESKLFGVFTSKIYEVKKKLNLQSAKTEVNMLFKNILLLPFHTDFVRNNQLLPCHVILLTN